MPAKLFCLFLLLTSSNLTAAEVKENTLRRIENYINNITTMEGGFTQDGPQSMRLGENRPIFSKGKFWISRPGKMRFEYTSPNKTRVVADGVWLAVKPKPSLPFERYPLNATPARFLLKGNLNIKRSAIVKKFSENKNRISLWLVAKDADFGGKIELRFRKNPLALDGWTIIDAQGLTTQIRLKNTKRGLPLDPALFFIQNETIFKKRRR